MQDIMGVIPASETLFANFNLVILGILLVVMPLLNRLIMTQTKEQILVDADLINSMTVEEHEEPDTPAGKLQHSRLIVIILVDADLINSMTVEEHEEPDTPAGKLQHSRLIVIIPGLLGLIYAGLSAIPEH